MRTFRTFRARVSCALLALAILSLGACGTSRTTGGGSGTSTPASATATPAATPAATKGSLALTTALCTTAITQTEVGQATGVSVTQVYPISKHDPTLNQDAVICTYIGGAGPVSLITFGVAPNASAIYPQLKQQFAAQSPGGVTDVPGLGDAAFWGISSGGSKPQDTSTGLVVLRGTLILEILTHGTNMLPADEQMAHLILSRV